MAIVPYLPGCTMERMPSSPYVICLGDAERAELESLSRRASAPFRLVLRSRIVLLAAAGTANRRDRGAAGHLRGHGPQVAAPVLRAGHRGAGRRAAPRQAARVPRPRRGRGQGPRVRDARRERDAPGPLDLPRAGPPCGSQRHRSRALGVHRAPLAG